MSRQNDGLPHGWMLARITDVVDRLQYGYTAKASNTTSGPKFLRITDIKQNGVDWANVPTCEISSHDFEKYRLYSGDVVFARTGSIEKAWHVENPPEAIFASYLIRGRPIEIAVGDWLAKFVQSKDYLEQISAVGAGIGRENVNARNLGQISFPLPPLAEQRRIVAKIEALQERSRRAREELSEVEPLLQQFRQSVLAAAFRGDLTADWRAAHPNIEPASELLHRIRAERCRRWEQAELAKYEAKGQKPPKNWQDKYEEPEPVDDLELSELPEGWVWATVDEISSHIVDCPHSTPKWTEAGKLCVRTTEFRPGHLDIANARFVSQETFDERNYRLKPQPGDILYSREGGILGISCQVPSDTELCLGQRMMLMRTDVHFFSRLLMHWLNSPRTLDRVKRLTLGSASPHLNVGEVKRFPVPVAPLDEQSKLLEQIESCLATPEVCGQMATDYEQQLDQLDQSILVKAFYGELVPQDPDDEPASALLERIREQKAGQAEATKPTSKLHRHHGATR